MDRSQSNGPDGVWLLFWNKELEEPAFKQLMCIGLSRMKTVSKYQSDR